MYKLRVCLTFLPSPPAVAVVGALLMAPILLKVADALKHAGQLQGPLMSLVNFFQVRYTYILSVHFFSFKFFQLSF